MSVGQVCPIVSLLFARMTPAVVRLVPFVLSWPSAFPLDVSDEFERQEVVYSGGNGTFADQGFSHFFLFAKRV